MTIPKRDIAKLVVDASARGDLSTSSLDSLQKIPDIQGEISRSLGGMPKMEASELLLVNILVDDSASIEAAGNTESVRQGHNRVAQAVLEAGIAENVLLQTSYLNGRVINPYVPLLQAESLNPENYNYRNFAGTPLFRQSVILLGSLAAKTEELERTGKSVRSISLIITDGGDTGSFVSPADVKWLVNDLRKSKRHIIAAMGVKDRHTNFRKVFRSMGIPDKWILLADSNHATIIKAFKDFGEAAAKASLDPASFERLALGSGFSS